MEKLKVSQIAQSLRVSNQTIYNYLSKFRQDLEGNLIRENGKTYLTQDGFKILKTCLGTPEPVETVKGSQNLESLIIGLKETIDNLIHQHAEERQRAAEERQRSDTIILKLTNDVGSLQRSLEYRNPEASMQTANSGNRSNPQKEEPPARSAPPISCQVEKGEPIQRELTLWESVQLTFNDMAGFLFGRG